MVNIPRTDLEIFPLNLGGNPFGWTADKETSFQILNAFVDAGGNFIDTADLYASWGEGNRGGESEEVLGQWRQAYPERAAKVIIATKSGGLEGVEGRSREATFKAVENSLQRLGQESIDLFYYHYDDEAVDIQEQVDIANELIAAGKIRYLALSNYTPQRLAEFIAVAEGTKAFPVAFQPQYNLLFRKEYESSYLAILEKHDIAALTYFSLASGLLTGKYRSQEDLASSAREGFMGAYLNEHTFAVIDELVALADARNTEPATVALAWLLAKGVTAPIASVSKPEQLDSLLAAPQLELAEEEIVRLDKVSEAFA